MTDRSLVGLMEFLDWTAEKGVMAKNTVAGRKAAVGKVLGVLEPEELSDVTSVDLDSAMIRFINLQGKSYNTSSLNVSKSRTNAAINDFERYLSDPLAFKPYSPKLDKKPGGAPKKKGHNKLLEPGNQTKVADQVSSPPQSVNVFPIQIRESLVVRIHGLPFDLTKAEADRIANVIKAMAMQ